MAESLVSVLDRRLRPLGFDRGRSRTAWVRESDARRHVVGIRHSRSGGGLRAVLFHTVPARDEEPFEISPVAPFKNTYWWATDPAPEDIARLCTQIDRVVLPYFRTLDAGFDPADALTTLFSALDALRSAEPPFSRSDTTFWRRRGPLFDLVDVEPVAGGVFTYVYVSVWHADLSAGSDDAAPTGITRAASITLGPDGIDPTPNESLFPIGPPVAGTITFDPCALVRSALAYFASIDSVDAVLARVRPEYREHFRGR